MLAAYEEYNYVIFSVLLSLIIFSVNLFNSARASA